MPEYNRVPGHNQTGFAIRQNAHSDGMRNRTKRTVGRNAQSDQDALTDRMYFRTGCTFKQDAHTHRCTLGCTFR